MKKLIALLLLCALVLSGCAQGAPAATQAPTETMAPTTEAPTEIPTEAPTEPLSEEELAQLKYEQLFANEEYVMDWNKVHMDVGMNLQLGGDYCLEIFHLENGFIWEALRPLEMDPCNYDKGMVNVYFQFDEETAYYYDYYSETWGPNNTWLYEEDNFGAVDMSSEYKETVMTREWNLAQSLFAHLMSKENKVLYLGNEEGLDMFILNPYGTEQLFFYIEPETNEVQKLYMKTLEKTYYVEFVQELPEYVANPTVPTRDAVPMTFEEVANHCEEIVEYLLVHRCSMFKDTAPYWPHPDKYDWMPYYSFGINLPAVEAEETEEVIAKKLRKWESIFKYNAYIMDWSSWSYIQKSGTSGNDSFFHGAKVTDEQGIRFTLCVERDSRLRNKYYRVDENTAYFNAATPKMGNCWYSVDVSSPQAENRVDEKCPNIWLDLQYAISLEYTKSVNGLDVISSRYVKGYSDSTIEMYINPETYEVKYIIFYDNIHDGNLSKVIELIYENDIYIYADYPEETEGVISYEDMAAYQKAVVDEKSTFH